MKDGLDRTGMKKQIKTAKKLHALECGTGSTSWICNNWTAGLTTVFWHMAKLVSFLISVC